MSPRPRAGGSAQWTSPLGNEPRSERDVATSMQRCAFATGPQVVDAGVATQIVHLYWAESPGGSLTSYQCMQSRVAKAPAREPGTRSHESLPMPHLPEELLLRLFRNLPAADLTQVACVCQDFQHAADDESLWRRLYCSRWRQLDGEAKKVMGRRFWKVRITLLLTPPR